MRPRSKWDRFQSISKKIEARNNDLKEKIIKANFKIANHDNPPFSLTFKAAILRFSASVTDSTIFAAILVHLLLKIQILYLIPNSLSIWSLILISVGIVILKSAIDFPVIHFCSALYPRIFKNSTFPGYIGGFVSSIIYAVMSLPLLQYFEISILGYFFVFFLFSLALTYVVITIVIHNSGDWFLPDSKFYLRNNPTSRRTSKNSEFFYVMAQDHFVLLVGKDGENLLRKSFAQVLKDLEYEPGARVHRSFWVSANAVDKLERFNGNYTLILKNGKKVPVSKTYTADALRLADK